MRVFCITCNEFYCIERAKLVVIHDFLQIYSRIIDKKLPTSCEAFLGDFISQHHKSSSTLTDSVKYFTHSFHQDERLEIYEPLNIQVLMLNPQRGFNMTIPGGTFPHQTNHDSLEDFLWEKTWKTLETIALELAILIQYINF